jgi:hypothetical protein
MNFSVRNALTFFNSDGSPFYRLLSVGTIKFAILTFTYSRALAGGWVGFRVSTCV